MVTGAQQAGGLTSGCGHSLMHPCTALALPPLCHLLHPLLTTLPCPCFVPCTPPSQALLCTLPASLFPGPAPCLPLT